MHVPASRLPPALACLVTMTDLENVQEVDERTGMEKMFDGEELFVQSLEATVQNLGLFRTEYLAKQVFSRAQSQLADGPDKQIVSDTVRLEGLLPFTQKLAHGRLDSQLTQQIVRKPPKHDRAPADLESDLNKHMVCSEAAVHAF
jgi:hypothetical protein